jgi:hypothetical protein
MCYFHFHHDLYLASELTLDFVYYISKQTGFTFVFIRLLLVSNVTALSE